MQTESRRNTGDKETWTVSTEGDKEATWPEVSDRQHLEIVAGTAMMSSY